jgi:hypothetical protein
MADSIATIEPVDRDVLILQGFAFGKDKILPEEDWETWTRE